MNKVSCMIGSADSIPSVGERVLKVDLDIRGGGVTITFESGKSLYAHISLPTQDPGDSETRNWQKDRLHDLGLKRQECKTASLRASLIRLAHAHPELRSSVLPLLK